MRELLEAGVHFGHQTNRWDPRMSEYIYAERNGIHVIDLHKTLTKVEEAYEFVKNKAAENGIVLFVGTKKQAQEAVEEEARRCNMPYVTQRWLGGTLTNHRTLKKTIARLDEIEKMETDGIFEKLPKKEAASLRREYQKTLRGVGGIRQMANLPAVIFIVDTSKEVIAVKEAQKLGIPIVGIVDTNANPYTIDYPIPANDDAIRSVKLICSVIADAVDEGRKGSKQIEIEAGEALGENKTAEQISEEAQAILEEERLEEQEALKLRAFQKEEEERKGL